MADALHFVASRVTSEYHGQSRSWGTLFSTGHHLGLMNAFSKPPGFRRSLTRPCESITATFCKNAAWNCQCWWNHFTLLHFVHRLELKLLRAKLSDSKNEMNIWITHFSLLNFDCSLEKAQCLKGSGNECNRKKGAEVRRKLWGSIRKDRNYSCTTISCFLVQWFYPTRFASHNDDDDDDDDAGGSHPPKIHCHWACRCQLSG